MTKFRPMGDRDEEQILALHEKTFRDVDGETFPSEEEMRKDLETWQVIVAEKAGRLLGYGGCASMSELSAYSPECAFVDSWNNTLSWAKNPESEDDAREFLSGMAEKVGGKVVLEYYPDTEIIHSTSSVVGDDYNLTQIAVLQEKRGEGIGKEITKRLIQIADEKNAPAMFTNSWLGGISRHIFEKQGFEPIIQWGPMYADGHGAMAMGKRFRPQQVQEKE